MRGLNAGLDAFALAISFRNVMQPAPSGDARTTSGVFDAMLVTCDVGGAESVASIVWSSTIVTLASAANFLYVSSYALPKSLFTRKIAAFAPFGKSFLIALR